MSGESAKPSIPRRLIVSLQVGGVFFALANVVCVAILARTYLAVKLEPKTLEVKGSAKKLIVSDTITWEGKFSARDADLVKAYEKLKRNADLVAAFVRKAGIPDGELTFSSVTTTRVYQREVVPTTGSDGKALAPSIMPTNKVEFYVLTQSATIESRDMQRVPAISRGVTELIRDGVEIESGAPRYLYSKLSELKIDMLAEATRDATTRASQIANNANGSLGRLVEARMGVMQINPKGVTDVSDTGNNDTTSLEKEINAVVAARFELK